MKLPVSQVIVCILTDFFKLATQNPEKLKNTIIMNGEVLHHRDCNDNYILGCWETVY